MIARFPRAAFGRFFVMKGARLSLREIGEAAISRGARGMLKFMMNMNFNTSA